ncbi:TRAP transporter [Alkalihalobacterium alkalinitrilicum]|uniref:TRAP transporter n=1 Tax=Alkalihalobacterium alkalinitrilicum TaxID=427920 RepID=UPI000994FBD2|nr:TRAP transporter [Alkalihalobacterium alkalinitrilicum]
MFKRNWLYAAVFTMLLIFLTACGGGGSEPTSNQDGDGNSETENNDSEETINLVAATGVSPQHGWVSGFFVPWMEKVTEETNGRVQFEQFHSGELVEITKEYDSMNQGIADVTLFPPIYDPQRFPMSEITMLPLTHSDTYIASKAYEMLLNSDVPLLDGKTFTELEYGDMGLVVMGMPTTMEYSISTTGKEFNSVDDIIGATLRTSSRIHEMYAQRIGANTITMPAMDMFDAMSRGAFEGSFYSIADWSGYGFQDLFMYTFTGVNFGHFNSLIAMTQDKWESLPEDVREIMVNAASELLTQGADVWVNRSEEMIDYSLENGGKFVTSIEELDPEVQEHFLSGIEETWYDYIDLLDDRGMPGKEVVKLWRDLIIEAGGSVPEGVMNLE